MMLLTVEYFYSDVVKVIKYIPVSLGSVVLTVKIEPDIEIKDKTGERV